MAKVLTHKNIRRSGNKANGSVGYHVTAGDTLSGTDFDFPANDGTGATLTFTPRMIYRIIVTSASAVTIDGNVYSTGTWDFTDIGGVPTSGPSIVVGAGNVLIKVGS